MFSDPTRITPAVPAETDPVLATADAVHRASLHASYAFKGHIFKNTPWLVVLTLFIAERSGLNVSMDKVRAANMLTRQECTEAVDGLVDAGLVLRSGDTFRLSGDGRAQLESMVSQFTPEPWRFS